MTDIRSPLDRILTPEYVRQNLEIRHSEDEGTIHTYRDASGEISSTVYQLFPGVSLVYKDVHRQQFITNWRYWQSKPDRAFCIEYCREGRLESQIDESCLYHTPGDIILFRTDHNIRELFYPIGHFHSVAITINPDEFSPCLALDLDEISFSVDSTMTKYQLNKHLFCVIKKNANLEKIFQDICAAPEAVKLAYWKVKVFELLLLLNSSIPEIDEHPKQRISRAQATVAKDARQYLIDHPYERITIDALAEKFSVSTSYLKTGFRAVYAISIKRFDREQKMQLAAQLLKSTDRQVSDIAHQFGYINASKFSSAFQSIMGKNPLEYRSGK